MLRISTLLAVLLVAACGPPAAGGAQVKEASPAAPAVEPVSVPPTVLLLEWGEAWNQHHVFGASGKRLYTTVTMQLFDDGKVRVEDSGELQYTEMDKKYGYEQERITWLNVWLGGWTGKDGAMILVLESSERTCKMVTRDYDGQETESGCERVEKKVRLECVPDEVVVELEDFSEETRQAWTCQPKGGDVDMGGTPLPWVFGKDSCIQVTSGPTSFSRGYSVCKEDEPPSTGAWQCGQAMASAGNTPSQ